MSIWGLVFFVLGFAALGVFLGSSASIRSQDRRFLYFGTQLSKGRLLPPLTFDTTQQRAERAIAARPHFLRIGVVLLVAGLAFAVAGIYVPAAFCLVCVAIACAGIWRADWLETHKSRWKIDE